MNFKKLLLVISSLTLAACSSTKKEREQELALQVKMQEPADTPDQIMHRAAIAFSNADGLTAQQKWMLSDIYSRVYTESMRIRREMGQSKSLLFMTLAKVDYKSSEIDALKKKIVELDQKRLKLMFDALDDVQRIVGKGIEAEKIYKHFQDYEMPNHRRD
ncbi:hypothetical protein K2P97_13015 [bacterium]|nr:hypothetical protein [bacterium]